MAMDMDRELAVGKIPQTEVICKSHSESSSGTDTKSSTELQHNDYHFTEELSSSPVIPSPARDNAVETARIVEYLGQTDRTGTDEGKIHQREKRNGRRKMKKSKDEDQITSVDRNMRYDSKEVKLCLKPKGIGKQCDPDHVAKELARCLSEVKYSLVEDVVRVLGIQRALELFNEVASIQDNGGEATVDGTRRRSPGGVFFNLVKKSCSADLQKEIFKRDRKLQVQKKRKAQKVKQRQREQLIKQREKELEERRIIQLSKKRRLLEGTESFSALSSKMDTFKTPRLRSDIYYERATSQCGSIIRASVTWGASEQVSSEPMKTDLQTTTQDSELTTIASGTDANTFPDKEKELAENEHKIIDKDFIVDVKL